MHTDNLKAQGTGAAQTFIGRVWRALGRLFGSRRMQIEGIIEETRGRANMAGGRAAEQLEGGLKRAHGGMERNAGKAGPVTGNESAASEASARELEAKARELEAKARHALN